MLSPGMPVENDASSSSSGPVHWMSKPSILPSPSSSMQFEHCGAVAFGVQPPENGASWMPPSKPPGTPSLASESESSLLELLLLPQAMARTARQANRIFMALPSSDRATGVRHLHSRRAESGAD